MFKWITNSWRSVFFIIFLLGIFLAPSLSLAADKPTYEAKFCPWNMDEKPPVLDKASTECKNGVVTYEGFVPCGNELYVKLEGEAKPKYMTVSCTFCHLFYLADRIVDFVVITLAPILIVFMMVIAGAMFFLGGAKPDLISKGKTVIKGILIGVFLLYGAYFIVGEALTIFGMTKHNPLKEVFQNGIFSIPCQMVLPMGPSSQQ